MVAQGKIILVTDGYLETEALIQLDGEKTDQQTQLY